jgi:hypothetical protein
MSADATTTTASPYGVWDKVKVSKEFFDHLIQHPLFQAEPKAINTAQYWLTAVDAAMERNDENPVPWPWKDIADRFQSYSQPYTEYRNALRDLGLIEFTRYRPPPSYLVDGECRKYSVTPLGRKLVLQGSRQWLYKLLQDRDVWRKNQVNISKRKVRRKIYSEPEKQIIHDFIANVTFDRDAVWRRLEQDKDTGPGQYRSGVYHVTALVEKDFEDLETKHGRIYNDFVALPSEYRPYAKFKNKSYIATLDIRACHPNFLGKLLREYFQGAIDELDGRTPGTNPNQSAIESARRLKKDVNLLALEIECNRWTDIFADTTIDPRQAIMREAQIRIDLRDMKECVNTWLNGGKKYERRTDGRMNKTDVDALEGWFMRNFSEMKKVWSSFNPKATGCLISEYYEGPLMLNPDLYRLGEELGLKLSNEYDGVGVFTKRDDPELAAKLEQLKEFIQRYSLERFDVPVVVKVEMV